MIKHIQKAIQITGSQLSLAERAGCSQAAIWKLVHGRSKKVSAELAIAIEQATHGAVTKHDLRPDLYPHPDDGLPPELRTPRAAVNS